MKAVRGGEFRFACYAQDFDATVSFYRDDLALPIVDGWDRGPDDKGAIFSAASGLIEILMLPTGEDFVAPRGSLLIEVEDVDAWHDRAQQRGLRVEQQPTDKPWGHRDLVLVDPNGLRLVLFSSVKA